MMYEASYNDRKGKKHEVLVRADGDGPGRIGMP